MHVLFEEPTTSRERMDEFEKGFMETVLESLENGKKALLRSVCQPGNTKALLWFPGYNDSFYNPDDGTALLAGGFDLYVLDPHDGGACRDQHMDSPLGAHQIDNMDNYREEIAMALDQISAAKEYTDSTCRLCALHGGSGAVDSHLKQGQDVSQQHQNPRPCRKILATR
jgi:hypothetical protein